MLCTKLPTLENGMAKLERTPKGARGIAVTYKIIPEAVWGDGKTDHGPKMLSLPGTSANTL